LIQFTQLGDAAKASFFYHLPQLVAFNKRGESKGMSNLMLSARLGRRISSALLEHAFPDVEPPLNDMEP
jgi:hypothetical protein